MLLSVVWAHHLYAAEIGTNLVSYPDPFLGTRRVPTNFWGNNLAQSLWFLKTRWVPVVVLFPDDFSLSGGKSEKSGMRDYACVLVIMNHSLSVSMKWKYIECDTDDC